MLRRQTILRFEAVAVLALQLVGLLTADAFATVTTRNLICRDSGRHDPVDCGVPFEVDGPPDTGELRGQITTSTRVTSKDDSGKLRHIWLQEGNPQPSGDVLLNYSPPLSLTVSRKLLWPPRSMGQWAVQVCHEDGELIETLHFEVEQGTRKILRVSPGPSDDPKPGERCVLPVQAAPVASAPELRPTGASGCTFEPYSAGANRISDLRWHPDGPLPRARWMGEDYSFTVLMRGFYTRPGWTLTLESEQIPILSESAFNVTVPSRGGKISFELVAQGPENAVEREQIELTCPEIVAPAPAKETEKVEHQVSASGTDLSFVPGLGMGPTSYKQSRAQDSSQISLTARFSFLYAVVPPRWYLGVTAFGTVVGLAPSGANAPLRFIGLNLRAGYAPPFVVEPWRFTLLGGIYYTTMIIPAGKFGFKNLWGPQIYPALRRSVGMGRSVSAHFKFSPITDGVTVLNLSNRELAGGGSYSFALANGRSLSIALDIANLSFDKVSAKTGLPTSIRTTSASISLGYGL